MTTLSALRTEILDDLERDSASDSTRVTAAISAAIRFYQPKRFFFNESRDVTFNTVASQWVYEFGAGADITTEFYRIDMILVEDTGNDYTLWRRDYRDIEQLNDNTATENRPSNYGYIDRSIVLYPIPDAAYLTRITGHVKVAIPADEEADNPWMTEAYELIRCRAKAYLYAHVYPDAAMAAVMREATKDALSSLREATTSKVMAGHVIPSDF